tara:strand:+ start:263 stop:637 length:375 start_codon:yes stop_codon:yes gene_type:complete
MAKKKKKDRGPTMAELITTFMDSPNSIDTEAQKELRKEFPITVVLACVRAAIEGALLFITALNDADDGKEAAKAFEEFMTGNGIARIVDLFETVEALDYAWNEARIQEGEVFIGPDKIVPTQVH